MALAGTRKRGFLSIECRNLSASAEMLSGNMWQDCSHIQNHVEQKPESLNRSADLGVDSNLTLSVGHRK